MMNHELLLYDDMKDSIVAFVDILGFNNRVKTIKDLKTFIDVAETIHNIKIFANSVDSDETLYSDFNFTAISDSIIISVPYNSTDKLLLMILLLHRIQFEMLFSIEMTLFRGFVTRGPVYHKAGVIFGTGYSTAYECEKIIGHAPRIVISPEIIKSLQAEFFCLKEDNTDGFHFIDYLNPLSDSIAKHTAEQRQSIDEFISHKLEEFSSNLNIYPKYRWLANYFTSSCQYFD